jgi:hypothetical protein
MQQSWSGRQYREVAVNRVVYAVVIACLTLTLSVGVAVAAAKKPATSFPTGAKVTVTSVPPFFYTFSWTSATGTFDSYRLDLVKAKGAASTVSFNAKLATRFTVETVPDEGYPYVAPGEYKVIVNAVSAGKVAASLAYKGTVTLK